MTNNVNIKELIKLRNSSNTNQTLIQNSASSTNLKNFTSTSSNSTTSSSISQTNSNLEKIKSEISNQLDQEIIQNYRIQISKLNEEYNSLTRNFESLCLKNKDDNNLIKKLEEELNFYKNKIKKFQFTTDKFEEEKNFSIQSLKEKIEWQNDSIKSLEIKIQNLQTISNKAQEKENFYKNYSTKLDEKYKNLISTHENSEREISKLRKELKILKEKEEVGEKLIKEKELSEKLLMESREKIKNLEAMNEETEKNFELKINILNRENEKYIKSLKENSEIISQLQKDLSTLKLQKDSLIQDNVSLSSQICEKIEEIKKLKIKQEKINWKTDEDSKLTKLEFSNYKRILCEEEEKFLMKEFEDKISQKLLKQEKKIYDLKSNIINIFEKQKRQSISTKEKILNIEDGLKAKETQILQKKKEISDLKLSLRNSEDLIKKISYERDSLKFSLLEIEKTQKEKFSVSVSVSDYEEQLDKHRKLNISYDKLQIEFNALKENLIKSKEEIKNKFTNLFSQIKSLSEKLRLSFDTLLLVLPCRSCGEIDKKLYTMECGHSLCRDCLDKFKTMLKPCIECNRMTNISGNSNKLSIEYNSFSIVENKNLNDVIIRFQFLSQTLTEIELIIANINEEFDKGRNKPTQDNTKC